MVGSYSSGPAFYPGNMGVSVQPSAKCIDGYPRYYLSGYLPANTPYPWYPFGEVGPHLDTIYGFDRSAYAPVQVCRTLPLDWRLRTSRARHLRRDFMLEDLVICMDIHTPYFPLVNWTATMVCKALSLVRAAGMMVVELVATVCAQSKRSVQCFVV